MKTRFVIYTTCINESWMDLEIGCSDFDLHNSDDDDDDDETQ